MPPSIFATTDALGGDLRIESSFAPHLETKVEDQPAAAALKPPEPVPEVLSLDESLEDHELTITFRTVHGDVTACVNEATPVGEAVRDNVSVPCTADEVEVLMGSEQLLLDASLSTNGVESGATLSVQWVCEGGLMEWKYAVVGTCLFIKNEKLSHLIELTHSSNGWYRFTNETAPESADNKIMRWGNGTHSTQAFGSLPAEDAEWRPLLPAAQSLGGFQYGETWCVEYAEHALIITNGKESSRSRKQPQDLDIDTSSGVDGKHTRLTSKGIVMQTAYRNREQDVVKVCHAFPQGGLSTPADVASIEEGLAYLTRHAEWMQDDA